jgi:hypothetical protein
MLSVLSDVSFSSFSLPHHSDLLIIADFGMSEAHPNIWNRDYNTFCLWFHFKRCSAYVIACVSQTSHRRQLEQQDLLLCEHL